jgi:hypothetical protein
MVESIKDPDAVAEAACRADLVSTDMKDMIVGFSDPQAKTRSLLQMIEGKVKNDCNLFHKFLAALRSLRLTELVSRLQNSYSKLYYENLCQEIEANVYFIGYRVMGRDSPTAIHCDDDKSSTCMSEAESDDVNDSEVSHAGRYEFNKKVHKVTFWYVSISLHTDCTGISFEDVDDSILGKECMYACRRDKVVVFLFIAHTRICTCVVELWQGLIEPRSSKRACNVHRR